MSAANEHARLLAKFSDAQDERHFARMREAIREGAEGNVRPAEKFFGELRAKLLSIKAAQPWRPMSE